jgi:enamine deaminase RidA (YjgF/YER057c/UK114 family)
MSKSKSPAKVLRYSSDVLDVVTVSRACFSKFYITAHPAEGIDPCGMFENLAEYVHENDVRIVSQDVFGSCCLHPEGIQSLESAFGTISWPVTWIECNGRAEKLLTGTQVYGVCGTDVELIHADGRIAGSIFEDDDARYCVLGDLRPSDVSRSRNEQALDTFEKMESVLKSVDMDFSHVVRTWLYIDHILDWYDDFNAVRNDYFKERGVFDGVVPASTGIGATNHAGVAVVADVVAIKPKGPDVSITEVESPLQCPAPDYKSSFSRALEVALSDHRRLYISGTASIEPGGKTIHVGDTKKQIDLTMEVAHAILTSRGMEWSDVSRAIAYFKDLNDTPLLDAYCKEHNMSGVPIAVAHGDICRDDLLFEIEADAVVV